MPDRTDIMQGEVHQIILRTLRQSLDLTEARCYEVTRPDQLPKVPSGSEYVLTVTFGDGSFEIPEQFDGQCCEEIDVTIMAFTRVNLDASNTEKMLLHDDKRGLLRLKHLILKTVVGKDPARENGEGWLRDLLYAKRSIAPDVLEAKTITVGGVGVVFGCKFDHDLTD